eukprot:3078504-Alexandrium_andersonii.AAC.2
MANGFKLAETRPRASRMLPTGPSSADRGTAHGQTQAATDPREIASEGASSHYGRARSRDGRAMSSNGRARSSK